MLEYLKIGESIFHKYLGTIIVKEIYENLIKADTGARGILEFAFYDFGKVLYFDEKHFRSSFATFEEYIEFCEKEKRTKQEMEAKAELERESIRLKQIEEELKRVKEMEQQVEEENKKKELLNRQKEIEANYIPITEKKSYFPQAIDMNSLMKEFLPKRETLLKIKKDQENKIKEILEHRKIKYLVHFTRVENLDSILLNGLVPVSIQQERNFESIHNDEQRIDSKIDCTSCSIEFPNYKLFYRFRNTKFPGTKWVTIVLNADLLFSPSNIVYYCYTNAAHVLPRVSNIEDLCTTNSFERMFYESTTTNEKKIIYRDVLQIKDCITTDPQAEILISDIIDPKYISCICFPNQSDINEYVKTNGSNLLSKYKHQVFSSFFNTRKDYMFWKKEC